MWFLSFHLLVQCSKIPSLFSRIWNQNKNFWAHTGIGTFCKLSSQKPTKRLKKRKTYFLNACVLEFNFASTSRSFSKRSQSFHPNIHSILKLQKVRSDLHSIRPSDSNYVFSWKGQPNEMIIFVSGSENPCPDLWRIAEFSRLKIAASRASEEGLTYIFRNSQ